jgi:hypothetical protein
MVILIANHPNGVITELKISLPEAVVMFSLETFGSPVFLGSVIGWFRPV